MRLRTTAAALALGLCTAGTVIGTAHADDVPPAFQNRPPQAVCDDAVPTIVGSGTIFGGPIACAAGDPSCTGQLAAGAQDVHRLGPHGRDPALHQAVRAV